MKKRISKILLLILTVMLCVSLAACDNGNNSGNGGGSEHESETAVFDITFNVNGGSAISNPVVKVKKGSTVSKPTEKPVKAGFEFQFWSANSKDEYIFTTKVMKKLTLTAVYKAKTYGHKLNLYEQKDKDKLLDHVSYNDSDNNKIEYITSIYDSKKVIVGKSSGATYDPDKDTANDTLAVPVTDLENDYFVYWYYKDKDGAEKRFTTWAKAPVEGKETTVEVLNSYKDTSVDVPELYAKWHSTLNQIDFRFYANIDVNDPTANDGSVNNLPTTETEAFKLNDKVEKFSTSPTRNGYTFDGWFYKVKETVDEKETWVEKDFVFLTKDEDGNEITDPAATSITENLFTKIGGTDENPVLGFELYARWRLSCEIKTAADWNTLAKNIQSAIRDKDTIKLNEYLNADIRIANDIALGAIRPLFNSELVFKGTFDGGVYDKDGKISGNRKITCTINPFEDSAALIGNSQGKIRNVDLICTLKLPQYISETSGNVVAAGLARVNTGTIERCNVSFSQVTDSISHIERRLVFGGIAAKNSGVISDCKANFDTVNVSANFFTFGGIAGENTGTITNCILGKLNLNVTSVADSNIRTGFVYAGGIAGDFKQGLISKCRYQDLYVECTYFTDAYAGGFSGFINGSASVLSECYGSGVSHISVEGDNAAAGGIVGRAAASGISGGIQKCYSVNIAVSAKSHGNRAAAGGIIGDAFGRNKILIDQCYADPLVNIAAIAENKASAYAGGLVGAFESMSLSSSFSLANVNITTPKDSTAVSSIGYLVGGISKKDGSFSADKLYYYFDTANNTGVTLTKNGVKYDAAANEGKGNFDIYTVIVSDKTIEKATENSNFMDNTWLEDNLGFITNKEKDGKPIHDISKIVWSCGDKGNALPKLFWAVKK